MFSFGLLLALTLPAGDVWPSFLGAGHRDVKPESLPLTWSQSKNRAWVVKTPGHGQSSPVVWKDRIFLTSIEGPTKDNLHVFCLALADGKELWRQTRPTSDPVKDSYFVSRAAATPVVDADGVTAAFESGDVFRFAHDGKELWKRSLAADYGKFKQRFGLGSSPAASADKVFVLADDAGPSYLVALKKSDGTVAWKTDRKPRQSWSSPTVATIAGVEQVVCSSQGSVDGYDAATGKLLWTYEKVGGNTGVTPLPDADGNMLIGASGGRGGENAAIAKESNLCLTVAKSANGFAPAVKWKSDKATVSWASPIVHQGHAYWVNTVGAVFCIDAATGEQRYAERLKQSCWATPVGVGDRVYFFGKDGATTVLAAGPKFKQLATNELFDPRTPPADAGAKESTPELKRAAAAFGGEILYGVAVVDGSIVARSGDRVYCVREGK